MKKIPITVMVVLGWWSCAFAEDQTVSFARDKWDSAKWEYVRLPHMPKVNRFEQRDTGIGCGTFDPEDSKQGIDYVLLATDTKRDDAEVSVTFTRGEQRGSAPGLILSPTYDENGAIVSGIGIYVASYTMAVWELSTDPETGKTKYRHMVRVTRWFAPDEVHTLRCRFSKAGRKIAVKIDDSDTFVLTHLDQPINRRVVLVGCHGACEFRTFEAKAKGELEWSATGP